MHPDQLDNAQHWELPTDAKTIQSFLVLCNFFRGPIRDYASKSAPLNQLLPKDLAYKGGQMPPGVQEAFTRLIRIVCSNPI